MRRSLSFALREALPESDHLLLVADSALERDPWPARLAALVDLADLVVLGQLGLVRGELNSCELAGIGAEPQLEHGELAELGDPGREIGAPAVERVAPGWSQ